MNAVLSSAAILLTVAALLRVGASILEPIYHLFPVASVGSKTSAGRRLPLPPGRDVHVPSETSPHHPGRPRRR